MLDCFCAMQSEMQEQLRQLLAHEEMAGGFRMQAAQWPSELLEEAAAYFGRPGSHRFVDLPDISSSILAAAASPTDELDAGDVALGVQMLLATSDSALQEGSCIKEGGALSLQDYNKRMQKVAYVLTGPHFVEAWQQVARLCTCRAFSLWGQWRAQLRVSVRT